MEDEYLRFTADVGGVECTECDEIICTWPMTLATIMEKSSRHVDEKHQS